MKKVLWFDVETTGLDPVRCGIIQLAGLIEIDGEIKEEFNFKCRPHEKDTVQSEALKVHGVSWEEIQTHEDPLVIKGKFTDILGKYVNKYDRTDKYYPAGYNCRFDIDFISNWFSKFGDNYVGSWINRRVALDPLPLLAVMDFKDKIKLPSYNLETVAGYFHVDLKAHDALSDIKATREIFYKIIGDAA